jgi:hypothetical protein
VGLTGEEERRKGKADLWPSGMGMDADGDGVEAAEAGDGEDCCDAPVCGDRCVTTTRTSPALMAAMPPADDSADTVRAAGSMAAEAATL